MAKNVKVQFEADTAKFNRGIEQVNAGLSSVTAKANKFKSVLTAALSLGAAGGAASRAEQIVSASEATGINPQDIQAVQRTLRLPDVNAAAGILKELQSKQAEALQLGAVTPVEGFGLLGLGPLDLVGKGPLDLFNAIVKEGGKLPTASQRLVLDELAIESDEDRGRLIAAFNDPTFQSRLIKNRKRAVGANQLIGASDAIRKGRETLNGLFNIPLQLIGGTLDNIQNQVIPDIKNGFGSDPTLFDEFKAERAARLRILSGATPPQNQAFTREEDFEKFIKGQPNQEIKKLMEQQLEELRAMRREQERGAVVFP